VTTGKVQIHKKSVGKKFFETFLGDDLHNITTYVIYDVLVPALKSTVVEVVKGGIDMFIYGEKQSSHVRREQGRSIVNYTKAYERPEHNYNRRDDSRSRATHDFDNIMIPSRVEAENVLSHLLDLIDNYREATVADLYELVGIRGEHVDRKYGWTNLSTATVTRHRNGGFVLNMPRTILLD
jgi:hypothetical protein